MQSGKPSAPKKLKLDMGEALAPSSHRKGEKSANSDVCAAALRGGFLCVCVCVRSCVCVCSGPEGCICVRAAALRGGLCELISHGQIGAQGLRASKVSVHFTQHVNTRTVCGRDSTSTWGKRSSHALQSRTLVGVSCSPQQCRQWSAGAMCSCCLLLAHCGGEAILSLPLLLAESPACSICLPWFVLAEGAASEGGRGACPAFQPALTRPSVHRPQPERPHVRATHEGGDSQG